MFWVLCIGMGVCIALQGVQIVMEFKERRRRR